MIGRSPEILNIVAVCLFNKTRRNRFLKCLICCYTKYSCALCCRLFATVCYVRRNLIFYVIKTQRSLCCRSAENFKNKSVEKILE